MVTAVGKIIFFLQKSSPTDFNIIRIYRVKKITPVYGIYKMASLCKVNISWVTSKSRFVKIKKKYSPFLNDKLVHYMIRKNTGRMPMHIQCSENFGRYTGLIITAFMIILILYIKHVSSSK